MIKHKVYINIGSNYYFKVYDEDMYYIFQETWINNQLANTKIRGSYPNTILGKYSAEQHLLQIIKNNDY